ncbi:CFEM domain-containing protein [Colletotrichum truncatum]|uniref:CFEM domain-containing protein n=1 Tax=Colletotrichum truncatum TaxID=5467 RepID=A0ACC3ZLB2_COLTU|nr:CFEM domain-containing protein [Colletotrichum truncatum]KAF6786848.1 CFEM domain-containing protein [Colletotrichum truncatum]
MKYSYVLLAAAGLVAAQKKFTDVIPACSKDCLIDAVKKGTPCSSIDDSKCICEATNYRNIYTVGVPCVLAACPADVATGELLPAAAQFCREVTGGATAPPVESASAAVSSAVSSAIASASASASAAASGAASNATASVTGAPTASSGSSGTAATVATTAQPAGAAAVGSMGAFGMIALGALAAF